MNKDQRVIQRKLRIQRYADEIGHVAKTCRYFVIGHANFHRWGKTQLRMLRAVSDALRGNFANYVVWKRPCRLNWVPEGLRAIEVCVIVGRLRN